MFTTCRYVQNSFSVSFRRYPEIRRLSNEFEDSLKEHFKGHYSQPQVIPVPDELDPEVPRLIFGSIHGFSQIIISQIGITLNVTYSPDWQKDISKGVVYLKERSPALYLLLKTIEDLQIYFCGLTTRVRIPIDRAETELFDYLRKNIVKFDTKEDHLNDINIKITTVLENKFFSNISIQNYRTWKSDKPIQGVPRLSKRNVNETGIEIIGDFNDRYSYNELDDYFSDPDISEKIIDMGFSQIAKTIKKFQEV